MQPIWEPQLIIPDLEDFCLQIGMGKNGRLFFRSGLTARQYFGRLIVHNLLPDAIRFQAHTLAKRNAVWWACLCLRSVNDAMAKPKQAEALKAVLRWVMEPSEANRLAAGAAGKAATFLTPIGCIAMSIFWSGGGHDPLLTANTLSVSLAALATEGDPTKIQDNMKRFLALGISIANRKYLRAPDAEDERRTAQRR
ncbi:MAG TPA: hypothetical protein VNH11_21870 [Pirellulales bacterium]|nr:hypothetical protein [Pirellulales bacterium]